MRREVSNQTDPANVPRGLTRCRKHAASFRKLAFLNLPIPKALSCPGKPGGSLLIGQGAQ